LPRHTSPQKIAPPSRKKITSQFFAPSKTSGSKKMIINHAKILKNLKKNGICCFCCAAYKKLKNKPNLNVVTRKKITP